MLLPALVATLAPGAAFAQCTTWPPPPAGFENDPRYAEVCHLPPNVPCPAPAPPLVESGSIRAQGAIVTATIPDVGGRVASAVRWKSWYISPEGYQTDLYTHESTQDIPSGGLPANSTVRFGLPGLVEHRGGDDRNYVTVAIQWTDGTTSCESAPMYVETPVLPASASEEPVLPSGMAWQIRDDFHRPGTDPKCGSGNLGDGVGPAQVYSDCGDPATGGLNGSSSQIADDEENALTHQAGGFTYRIEDDTELIDQDEIWHSNTYADAKVRTDRTDPAKHDYNFQIFARHFETGLPGLDAVKTYAVKLVKGRRGCNGPRPALFVVRLPDEYGDTICLNAGGQYFPKDPTKGVMCTEDTPLSNQDGTTGRSKPAWLSIKVISPGGTGSPVVTGKVEWWENGVRHECSFTRTDADDPAHMNQIRDGHWGMGFHENDYYVDTFRVAYE